MYTKEKIVAAARGDIPMDTVIRNVNLINVFTAEIYTADIGIKDNVFGAVARYEKGQPLFKIDGKYEIDAAGMYAAPGFIDCHVHIESSMMTPENFAASLLERGTTTAVIDPHEIANVLGKDGVKYMIEASRNLPLDILVTIPSAVPAVPGLETSGAVFEADDIDNMLQDEKVIGIAEIMDYIGVINQSDRMASIIDKGLERDVYNEGHLPRTTGRNLDAYLAAGVDSDHESRSSEEFIEKLRQGMNVYIRESSVSQFAYIAGEAWREVPYAANIAMCTDDVEASDIYKNGQMNNVVKRCIEEGIPPALAVRYASLNGAKRFNLKKSGGIAPGFIADFLLIKSLEEMDVSEVFKEGKHLVSNGKLINSIQPAESLDVNTVKLPKLEERDFVIKVPEGSNEVTMNTIEMTKIGTTEKGILKIKPDGDYIETLPADYVFVSVTGRHGQNRKPFVGVLKNAGLKHGAYATTLAHDSHNLIVIGTNKEDMYYAVKYLEKTRGGLCLAADKKVKAAVDLPVAGLMSKLSIEELAPLIDEFNVTAMQMGVKVGRRSPSMAISSLALTVIPEIRMSDLGLVDVREQKLLPLFI